MKKCFGYEKEKEKEEEERREDVSVSEDVLQFAMQILWVRREGTVCMIDVVIFTVPYDVYSSCYRGALQFLKSINPLLAKHQKLEKGISKPGVDALKNTDDLYELIGRPLDVIPTIHVAGTNGKVSCGYNWLNIVSEVNILMYSEFVNREALRLS